MSVVVLYIVIGALLSVLIFLLIVVLVFTIYTVRNHRVKQKSISVYNTTSLYEIPFWLNYL